MTGMRQLGIWKASLVAVLLCAVAGCTRTNHAPPQDESLAIKLRWIKSYPSQTQSKVDTGLYWALSFLGARLPEEADVLVWNDSLVTVDLGAAGVSDASKEAWRKLLTLLKSSEEYQKMGAIDIGRFVYLSLCSANQYYALTGVSPNYADFRAKHEFAAKQMAVVQSAVAYGNRLIELENGNAINSVSFVAYEGTGSLAEHTFQKQDIETLDLMDNGQLRFGLYDLDGHLKTGASPALTAAGKPSKCLWCHEINLQPPFSNVTDVPGYYGTKEFKDQLAKDTKIVAAYRKTLKSKVYFSHLQDHSHAEALYMSFAEPTVSRLAVEWNLPPDRVRDLLASKNLKPHPHSKKIDDEILGDELYDRNDVEPLAPYQSVRGSTDMRETSAYEPEAAR